MQHEQLHEHIDIPYFLKYSISYRLRPNIGVQGDFDQSHGILLSVDLDNPVGHEGTFLQVSSVFGFPNALVSDLQKLVMEEKVVQHKSKLPKSEKRVSAMSFETCPWCWHHAGTHE